MMVQLLKLGERNRKKSPHSLTLFIRIFTYFYVDGMICICWFDGAVLKKKEKKKRLDMFIYTKIQY